MNVGKIIPESPMRTLGEQLQLARAWRKFTKQLPTNERQDNDVNENR